MSRLLLLVAVLMPVPPTAAQSSTNTTYSVLVRATHDVLTMPLWIKRLDFDERERIDFRDPNSANAAIETVWVYDGSFEGAPVAADALPDTSLVAHPLLDVRSPDFAQALTTFQPHFIGRVFNPPFDTLVVNKHGQWRERKDFSISYVIGFRSNAARSAFMTAVAPLNGVLWATPDRRLDEHYTDDL